MKPTTDPSKLRGTALEAYQERLAREERRRPRPAGPRFIEGLKTAGACLLAAVAIFALGATIACVPPIWLIVLLLAFR